MDGRITARFYESVYFFFLDCPCDSFYYNYIKSIILSHMTLEAI